MGFAGKKRVKMPAGRHFRDKPKGGEDVYHCAQCTLHACNTEETDKLPAFCPMRERPRYEGWLEEYASRENRDFYQKSAQLEATGYGRWSRLRETIEFCRMMGYRRVGLAFCLGLAKEAGIIDELLRGHGLKTVSVICKTGAIAKERAGITPAQKISPDSFEPMCNPIAQARLLNGQKTEFNILVGLCVGHDSLFYRYSEAPVTTLIAKDRVLAHNPAGAVYCAGGYYKDKL